jgi:hypothetical protein
MTLSTIAQSSNQVQSTVIYEYSFTVINSIDNDTQKLTAAFASLPTVKDWSQWLTGWISCGYSLTSQPQLIRTI